jgi:eukaryotic-like serine/threonine-protein kinase
MTKPTGASPNDLVAEYIGPYRLLRRLGEGGMGTVYLAEREQAGFVQRVALKLLRAGFLDQRLAENVAHERRVLARLEHPNIARLIDGGSTASGQPFLAMEYVQGDTLLEHVTREGLPLRARLELFIEVCEAVQYAHQQLVIHRDIKPSNVMVGPDGRPRLLDFGLAKLLDPEEEHAGVTRSTPWVTPAYASPEQVQGRAVSTLTDVYSLGVMLYELLSGVLPYDLQGKTPAEMERLICEQEPPRPSARAADPKTRRSLEGDLDTIVLKALAKRPIRRYSSAEQLAEDLRRYLGGHPVLAQPDSFRYRAGKFIRRNRTAVSFVLVAAILIVTGIIVVERQASVARTERDRAEAARQQAEQIGNYVIGLFEAADPASMDTIAARALLRQGVERAEALTGQPLAQASMFDALGMVFVQLQRFDQAAELVNRAWQLRVASLPPDHPDLAESQGHLGRIYRTQSKYPEALASYQQALAIRLKAFGPRHPKVAESYRDLAFLMPYLGRNQESVEYYRDALAIDRSVLKEDHPQTAEDLGLVGLALRRVGQDSAALSLLEQALATKARVLGPEDPVTARFRFHVADQLGLLGRDAAAEAMYRQGIASLRSARGNTDRGLTHGLGNLAALLGKQDRGPEAEALLRDVVAIQAARYGDRSGSYAGAEEGLSQELARQGRYPEALALEEGALAIWRTAFGTNHAAVAAALDNMAVILLEMKRLPEAERAAREGLEIRMRIYGATHSLVGLSYLRLAEVLTAERRWTAAESAGRKGLEVITANQPLNRSDARQAHEVLARLYDRLVRRTEAAREWGLARELEGAGP